MYFKYLNLNDFRVSEHMTIADGKPECDLKILFQLHLHFQLHRMTASMNDIKINFLLYDTEISLTCRIILGAKVQFTFIVD
jgi:hypothetical protein